VAKTEVPAETLVASATANALTVAIANLNLIFGFFINLNFPFVLAVFDIP